MEHDNKIEVFFKIDTLKLKEEIEDLYIYQDNNKSEFSIYYNDEIKFPVNLQKVFQKKYGKVKNFFGIIEDIKAEFNNKEKLVKLTYTIKENR